MSSRHVFVPRDRSGTITTISFSVSRDEELTPPGREMIEFHENAVAYDGCKDKQMMQLYAQILQLQQASATLKSERAFIEQYYKEGTSAGQIIPTRIADFLDDVWTEVFCQAILNASLPPDLHTEDRNKLKKIKHSLREMTEVHNIYQVDYMCEV